MYSNKLNNNMQTESNESAPTTTGESTPVNDKMEPQDGSTGSQNVTFMEAAGSVLSDWSQSFDPTMAAGKTDELSLEDFLARPVRIASYTWSTDIPANLAAELHPWELMMERKTILEKVQRFAMMRANINVRFVINGSPFLYGRIIAGVVPYARSNQTYGNLLISEGFFNPSMLAALSQGQHGFLDPSASESLELKIPFMSPKNWIRLYGDATSSKASTLVDVMNQPTVAIRAMNPLRQGNGAVTESKLNISVFAWFSEVELAVPTSSLLSEGPTPTEVNNTAAGKPSISSVASAAEGALAMLAKVPIIGPFALASSIAAGSTAAIAKIFGFSRPINLSDPIWTTDHSLPNLAATQGAFNGFKMSVDPQQALTVDPRVGMCNPSDELSIAGIAARETFITPISWTDSNLSSDGTSLLFTCEVNPMIYATQGPATNPVTAPVRVMPSPSAFAALPFTWWKGTMRYRFQVVASQYHRGKVAIYYEPNCGASGVATGTDFTTNTHLTTILDLQDLDNYELVVPWYTASPMLKVIRTSTDLKSMYYPFKSYVLTPPPQHGNDYSNGFFRIQVINELTSATSPVTPIEINMYTRCDDLQVAVPRAMLRSRVSRPGTLISESAATVAVGGFDSASSGNVDILGATNPTENNFLVVFGENVVSFRTLLKRFSTEFESDNANRTLQLPLYPRSSYLLNPTTVVDVPNDLLLFEYLKTAFVGIRGGTRRIFRTSDTNATTGSMVISNLADQVSYSVTGLTTPFNSKFEGTVVKMNYFEDGVAIETPCYSPYRYHVGVSYLGMAGGNSFMPAATTGLAAVYRAISSGTPHVSTVDFAVADDFSFIGFWATPVRVIGYL